MTDRRRAERAVLDLVGAELENYLLRTNPWWEGRAGPDLPPFRRWLFDTTLQRVKNGLAPITVLRGPRQVGKTTLQQQIISHLLEEGVSPKRIFRLQFDEMPPTRALQMPIITLCGWFESVVLGDTFNEWAQKGELVYLFFDEVQNLPDWAPQMKALVDHHTVRVLLTGSSALRIERGRDSLAGRISSLDLGTLLLREIAALRGIGERAPLMTTNGLRALKEQDFWESVREHGVQHQELRDEAFAAFSERGGYPVAQARPDRPWEELADHLNETVIRRAIQHDLGTGGDAEHQAPGLFEETFRLCCRYAGEAPGKEVFVNELRWALDRDVSWERTLACLDALSNTLLIRLVRAAELRLKKARARPKVCLCDHSLRASWLEEVIPISPDGLEAAPHLRDLAGHIVESIVGYFLGTIPNLDLAWFPERGAEPEVDFVLTVGEQRIPLEVKYRRHIDEHRDTLGLRAFLEKTVYNAPFGILVTLLDDVEVKDPRIATLPLSSLLLMR